MLPLVDFLKKYGLDDTQVLAIMYQSEDKTEFYESLKLICPAVTPKDCIGTWEMYWAGYSAS